MEKPLYLEARGQRAPQEVRLDGPALRVCVPGEADRLFPLRRLSRVLVSGPVEWQTDAILACAGQGVPLVFLDREGGCRARVTGPPGTDVRGLFGRLVALLDRDDGPDRYAAWQRAMAQRARLESFRELPSRWYDGREVTLRRLVDEAAGRYLRADALATFDRRLRTLLGTHVGALLQGEGVPLDAPVFEATRVRLDADLSDLVWWFLQKDKLRYLKWRWRVAQRRDEPVRPPSARSVASFYEHNAELVAARLRRYTGRLHRFCVEVLRG